jgi:pimeloyl-ACP methyl ester carboxylesterase
MMKHIVKTVAIVAPLLAFVGCGDGLDDPSENVKGGELLIDFPSKLIKPSLVKKGLIPESQTVYGYKAYKIPYTTTDEEGEEVKASGVLVLPTEMPEIVNTTLGLSMVSDDHGTIFANREAPTPINSTIGSPPVSSAIILASIGGFATLQPDYIGFGDSNDHYHPFIMKKSLANATVDFIKTVKTFATQNNIKLNNQLFLTGYSEGGYAAMATLKKIEDENLTDLKVTMAAPMAGPYALEPMSNIVLGADKLTVPSFMANVGYSYAKAYNKDIETVINEPYASKLPTLFNGDLNRSKIDPELTLDTKGATGLFVGNFVENYFTDSEHWFKQAMLENNLHLWAPKTPLRLVHCEGDNVIPYLISTETEKAMKAYGSTNIAVVPVEKTLGLPINIGHSACGTLGYKVTTGLFAQKRKETIGY